MSNAPEEFEQLQKLLKLKRYEQPPPGYFNQFSSRVITRIETEAERSGGWEHAQWLRSFMRLLETNPLAAGGFGMAVCALLISGIVYSQDRSETYSADTSAPGVNMAAATTPEWGKNVRVDSTMPSISSDFSTNNPNALFGSLGKLSVQQVNFNP